MCSDGFETAQKSAVCNRELSRAQSKQKRRTDFSVSLAYKKDKVPDCYSFFPLSLTRSLSLYGECDVIEKQQWPLPRG